MWNKFQPGPLLDQRAGQAGSMNCDCNQVHGHKSNFIMNEMRKAGAHPASCSWSQIKFIHKIIMNEMRKTGALLTLPPGRSLRRQAALESRAALPSAL